MTNRPQSNTDLLDRSLSAVWHPCSQMKHYERFPLVPIARGSGVWLYDYDNKRYLDAVSSWWVNLFGHCNPRINAALRDQLETLEHVMLAGFTHEPVVQLSERLRELAPAGLGHCFYASDGASATEIALKMSAHYWRNSGKPDKTQFISLENSYHGETLGALSVTDVALFRSCLRRAGPAAGHRAQPGLAQRRGGRKRGGLCAALRGCARAIFAAASCAAGRVHHRAAGAGRGRHGDVSPGLSAARAAALQRVQVHLIADEIAVGMGRTGTMFACEQAPALRRRARV